MEELNVTLTGLFISAFISSTIAPGGSEAVLAYLVSTEKHNAINLIIIATVGNSLGALTTWVLGVIAAKKFPLDQMLSPSRQKSLDLVRRWGGWVMFFSWLPVVGDGLCFAGGWLRLSLFFSLPAIVIGKALRYGVIAFFFV